MRGRQLIMNETPNLSIGHHYPVGYGKPPVESRFKKGQSGNPKGRPKGAKNKVRESMKMLTDIVKKEASREVEVNDKNEVVTMTVAEAVVRSISLKAVKGNVGAQKLFMGTVGTVEEEQKKEMMEAFDRASAYKRKKSEEIKLLKAKGKSVPKILPHPDGIELDYGTGKVYFHGPINEDDEKEWHRLHHQIEALEDEIESTLQLYKSPKSKGYRDQLDEELADNRYILQLTTLSAMNRWHLPAHDWLKKSDYTLRMLLDAHYKDGTKPERPDSFKLPDKSDLEEFYRKYANSRPAKKQDV